jgi:hypothetical protein
MPKSRKKTRPPPSMTAWASSRNRTGDRRHVADPPLLGDKLAVSPESLAKFRMVSQCIRWPLRAADLQDRSILRELSCRGRCQN